MATNRSRLSGMTPRQIGTIVVFILVIIVIAWQLKGLFGTSKPATKVTTTTVAQRPMPTMSAQPQPASLSKQVPMSQRELDLMRMQQETQAKYLESLNELQMLRLQRDIAQTNQAIAVAKLATVTAQKNTVNLLAPPPPPPPAIPPETYAKNLVTPGSTTLVTPKTETAPPPANYTVVSVTRILNKWSAVLGYQGNLYNVSVGDILPPDNSKVVSINKSGVRLKEKDGTIKKISLVPII